MAFSDFDSTWGPGLENLLSETQVGGQQAAVVGAAKAHVILITSVAVRRLDSHARSASSSNRYRSS